MNTHIKAGLSTATVLGLILAAIFGPPIAPAVVMGVVGVALAVLFVLVVYFTFLLAFG